MRRYFTYDHEHPADFIFTTMVVFALSLIVFGFFCDSPWDVLHGIATIVRTQAGLITDSIVVGGLGAAFVNAGLVMLIAIALMRLHGAVFSGVSVACLFLMAGFALFGKDILNIFPILLGGWLYAVVHHEPFSRYVYVSLFGTCLAPAITELAVLAGRNLVFQLAVILLSGIVIGFLLPPIASYTLRVHQGYNLYNVGFAGGLIGMVLASVLKSFGYTFQAHMRWSQGNNRLLGCFLFLLFFFMFATGFFCNGRSLRGLWRIMRHSGRTVADFILLDGYAVVLMNMAVVGAVATLYVLLVGGPLNGPTIGGIFTICGFGAFGKHLRNITPVVLGVVVSSMLMVWKLDDPNVLLAALFSTGLAPIAGQFGWFWGFLSGAVHASVVLNVGFLHGGLNLYNNGFAAGLVCIVMLPVIEAFRKDIKK